MDRRSLALLLGGAAASWDAQAEPAGAAEASTVVVAGATGQTGRRIVERLSKTAGVQTVATVRDIAKAQKALSESSVTVRGAMIEQVGSVDTTGVQLKKLDVAKDTVSQMAETLKGASSLVIATGFVPGNPFSMNDEAKKVDNVGTKLLVDAAKQAGVRKVVLVSSILTNGRAWGQENSPGFVITNAFGSVLDEKLVAEKYLRGSGLEWTIVRPGGLKATPPSGNLVVSKEDTLNSGEVSRDLVADVCVAALFDGKSSNRVLEIIEDEGAPKKAQADWFA
jgi:nucleoside-diphosphate-sugar epimerase